MIPDLSLAISSSVGPKRSIWSIPIDVSTETKGVIILVVSFKPPTPTSIDAKSHLLSRKYKKLAAVRIYIQYMIYFEIWNRNRIFNSDIIDPDNYITDMLRITQLVINLDSLSECE